MKRILIADHDQDTTFTLKKVLQAESYEVQSCNDTDLLINLSGRQNYDLIVVNSGMMMMDGSSPLPSLQTTQPGAAFILIYDQDSSEPKNLPRVFDQIQKPLDFRHVINRIRELFNGGGFSGIISGINLADYMQMLCMNKITKAVLIRKNKQQGIILILEGRIIYCDTAELKGEAAIHEILSWKEGQIKEVKVKKFPKPNIDMDIQQLLLNSTLMIDESEETFGLVEKDDTLLGSEIMTELQQKEDTPTHISNQPLPPVAESPSKRSNQASTPATERPAKGSLSRYLGIGAAVVIILLSGLFLSSRNYFEDEVEASGTLSHKIFVAGQKHTPKIVRNTLEAEGVAQNALTPTTGPTLVAATSSASVANGADNKPGVDHNASHARNKTDTSQKDQRITVAELKADESSLEARKVILRLHGSNTIGAKLAPALVKAYLRDKLHATEIQNIPGKKENEQTIEASLNGKPIAVEIQAHGSSTAFRDLKAGTCDIGDASRKIKKKEEEELSFLGDMTGLSSEHVIGLDGIAVLVNTSNPINQISTKTLQAIFSGKITDWKGINGQDKTISIYSRDDKSGTYDTFKSIILDKEHPLTSSAKRYESNADLSDDVSRAPTGIGFTALPYVRDSKPLAVWEEGARPIYPNFFTVATEDYPISRRLYMYTAAIPKNPHVAPFINFVLSEDGQKVAMKNGFIDMNIRAFSMDPAAEADPGSLIQVRDYLNAVKGAQRLSLNFRFKFGTTALDNRSIRDLDRIISYLADKLDKRIILAGFADNSGDYKYNYQLAMARARLVASELKARGIAVSKTFSCGQEMPVASNMTPLGREKNRRVEVWLK